VRAVHVWQNAKNALAGGTLTVSESEERRTTNQCGGPSFRAFPRARSHSEEETIDH
jgi:hypothetical protein